MACVEAMAPSGAATAPPRRRAGSLAKPLPGLAGADLKAGTDSLVAVPCGLVCWLTAGCLGALPGTRGPSPPAPPIPCRPVGVFPRRAVLFSVRPAHPHGKVREVTHAFAPGPGLELPLRVGTSWLIFQKHPKSVRKFPYC